MKETRTVEREVRKRGMEKQEVVRERRAKQRKMKSVREKGTAKQEATGERRTRRRTTERVKERKRRDSERREQVHWWAMMEAEEEEKRVRGEEQKRWETEKGNKRKNEEEDSKGSRGWKLMEEGEANGGRGKLMEGEGFEERERKEKGFGSEEERRTMEKGMGREMEVKRTLSTRWIGKDAVVIVEMREEFDKCELTLRRREIEDTGIEVREDQTWRKEERGARCEKEQRKREERGRRFVWNGIVGEWREGYGSGMSRRNDVKAIRKRTYGKKEERKNRRKRWRGKGG